MKERPILFSSPMVRAILAGRKTQTRRVVKGQRPAWDRLQAEFDANDREFFFAFGPKEANGLMPILSSIRCPYGQPGDRLWVRERWRIGAWSDDLGAFAIDYCDGPRCEWLVNPDDHRGARFKRLRKQCRDELNEKGVYQTDGGGRTPGYYSWQPGESPLRWRPSIHMPRWASRITLEVTGVRVERLQAISQTDAMAEGAPPSHASIDCISREYGYPDFSRSWFAQTWEQINGAGSWEANPWVWVVSFRHLKARA